jgi:hypothetical protein
MQINQAGIKTVSGTSVELPGSTAYILYKN